MDKINELSKEERIKLALGILDNFPQLKKRYFTAKANYTGDTFCHNVIERKIVEKNPDNFIEYLCSTREGNIIIREILKNLN